MLQLYFSLSSSVLFLALWEKDKCLVNIQKENKRLHSENFLFYLGKILKQTNHSLKEMNRIYFTSVPSGQTGLRISLSFLSTLQVLNPDIELYHINTLLLQASNTSCISLLTIDKKANKLHAAVYQNKKCLLESQIMFKNQLEKLTQKFPNFLILKDFYGIDFLNNFQELKDNFSLLKNIDEINYF